MADEQVILSTDSNANTSAYEHEKKSTDTVSYRETRALWWFFASSDSSAEEKEGGQCDEASLRGLAQKTSALGDWLGGYHLTPSLLDLSEAQQYHAILNSLVCEPFEELDPLFQKLVTYSFEDETFEQTEDYYKMTPLEDMDYFDRFKLFLASETDFEHNAILKLYIDQNANENHHETSPLARALYKRLWPWLYSESSSNISIEAEQKLGTWECQEISYDVMNSFKTTDIFLLEKQAETNDESVRNNNVALEEFANLTHSLGNFTPIPHRIRFTPEEKLKPFNFTRGNILGPIQDYWDRSLVVLKQYFEDSSPEEDLFSRYANAFYLQGYLEGAEIRRYSQDVTLFPEHANSLIKTRGIVLTTLLILKKLFEMK